MIIRMVMPRALARLATLLHTPARRVAAAPAPAATTTGATLSTTAAPPSQAREVVPAVAAGALPAHGRARTDTAPPAPAPLGPRHEEGVVHAQARRWGHAQRALEAALRADPEPRAAADLASVREVRRQLRILRKWPRDVPAHVALGRAYMDLDLGPEAEAAFLQAIALAPTEPAAYGHLALEYTFAGRWRLRSAPTIGRAHSAPICPPSPRSSPNGRPSRGSRRRCVRPPRSRLGRGRGPPHGPAAPTRPRPRRIHATRAG
jgi:tetratricopeptide (TPR) repeat protein